MKDNNEKIKDLRNDIGLFDRATLLIGAASLFLLQAQIGNDDPSGTVIFLTVGVLGSLMLPVLIQEEALFIVPRWIKTQQFLLSVQLLVVAFTFTLAMGWNPLLTAALAGVATMPSVLIAWSLFRPTPKRKAEQDVLEALESKEWKSVNDLASEGVLNNVLEALVEEGSVESDPEKGLRRARINPSEDD